MNGKAISTLFNSWIMSKYKLSLYLFFLGSLLLPIELFPLPGGGAGWNNYSPLLFSLSALLHGNGTASSIKIFYTLMKNNIGKPLPFFIFFFLIYQCMVLWLLPFRLLDVIEQYIKVIILVTGSYAWYVHFFLSNVSQRISLMKAILIVYSFSLLTGVSYIVGLGSFTDFLYYFHKAGSSSAMAGKVIFTFSEASFVLPHAAGILLLISTLTNKTLNISIKKLSILYFFVSLAFCFIGFLGGSNSAFIGLVYTFIFILMHRARGLSISSSTLHVLLSLFLFLLVLLFGFISVLPTETLLGNSSDPSTAIRFFRSNLIISNLNFETGNPITVLFGNGIGNVWGASNIFLGRHFDSSSFLSTTREFQSILQNGGFSTSYSLPFDLISSVGIIGCLFIFSAFCINVDFIATVTLFLSTFQFGSIIFPGIMIYLAASYLRLHQRFIKA